MAVVLAMMPMQSVASDIDSRVYTSPEQVECMAKNIYHEARGESYEGQIAVAWVVMNRLESEKFPGDTICQVINQRGQFEWVPKNPKIREREAWKDSIAVAEYVISEFDAGEPDPTNGALFFNSSNRVTKASSHRKKIGKHVFYN